jgi:hypothetical protein
LAQGLIISLKLVLSAKRQQQILQMALEAKSKLGSDEDCLS